MQRSHPSWPIAYSVRVKLTIVRLVAWNLSHSGGEYHTYAVSPDGRTAYTLLQSPMGSTSAGNPTAMPPIPPSPAVSSRWASSARASIW